MGEKGDRKQIRTCLNCFVIIIRRHVWGEETAVCTGERGGFNEPHPQLLFVCLLLLSSNSDLRSHPP